jgi:uncharacterized phage infection (PIP) family protein YhgE
MTVLIIVNLILMVLILNLLRLKKYRNRLEPNSQIIVALLNSLQKKKISKK